MGKKTNAKAQRKPVVAPEKTTLPTMVMQQGDLKMYAFVAPSDLLRKIATVSRRIEDKERGFQRHFKDSRLRQIGRFIDGQGTIPNNIILDFFDESVSVNEEKHTITIPSSKECAWVIDGQHRLLGFDHTKIKYPLLVLGFVGLTQEQKVRLFVTINTEQKRLPSSLCLDLLDIIGSEEDINTRARDLVAKLNEDEDSPWYDLIDMTGEGGGFISLVNFVRKLKPLISGVGFMKDFDFTDQYKILANYWRGIRAVFADQWGKGLLTKTLGFGALMNIFPNVFTKTLAMHKGEFTVQALVATFSLIKDLQFDSDTLGSGAGNKAEMKAGDIITEALETAIRGRNVAGKREGPEAGMTRRGGPWQALASISQSSP